MNRLAALVLLFATQASAAPLYVDATRKPAHHRPDLPRAVPSSPVRIVSLAPVATETLFALGAGSRVVGVTRFCDRPAEAVKLPKVGGYVDPDLEKILSLKPDLVVAMPSFGHRVVLDALRERGVPVLVVFGDTLGEVKDLVVAIGLDVGKDAEAQRIVADLDRRLTAVAARAAQRTKRPRTAVVVGDAPIVVAGPGTFADEALGVAGAVPATARSAPAWPTWSLEALIGAKADVLVAAEGADAKARLDAVLDAAFPKGDARRPRVVAANRAILMRPGPSLAEDVEALAALLDEGRSAPVDRRDGGAAP